MASRWIFISLILTAAASGCGDSSSDTIPPSAAPQLSSDGQPDDAPATDESSSESEATPPDFSADLNTSGLSWEHSDFGSLADGTTVEQYTLKNSSGTVAKLINYGATLVALETADRSGSTSNIVLSHQSVEGWFNNISGFGGVMGRFAGRINEGVFGLNGNVYSLATNDAPHHRHGGLQGFHRALWNAEASSSETESRVVFSRRSPDQEDRYPGNLDVTVTYTLTEDNELRIDYNAVTDAPTVINLTNHSYWNLTGQAGSQDVLAHRLTLHCDRYLPLNDSGIPTGDIAAVADTPLNFTMPQPVGSRIKELDEGYDHCFVINRDVDGLSIAADLYDPESGRFVEVYTTEPGLQFVCGRYLDGSDEAGGYAKYHGLSLMPLHYPDSPNQPHFPPTVLQPDETWHSTTVYRFDAR